MAKTTANNFDPNAAFKNIVGVKDESEQQESIVDKNDNTVVAPPKIKTDNTNNTYVTDVTYNVNNTKVKNKSKHYDKRGKRGERFGILLDEKLKDDLTILSKITGSKSINDLIITVLLEYAERGDNQEKIKQYLKLFKIWED